MVSVEEIVAEESVGGLWSLRRTLYLRESRLGGLGVWELRRGRRAWY